MSEESAKDKRCQVCGETRGAKLRPALAVLLRKDVPGWVEDGWICADDLARYRNRYVESLMEAEKGSKHACRD